MLRKMMFLAGLGLALPAAAATQAEKQADCALQAELIGAVQTARLDWVRKNRVADRLLEQNPDWPAGVAEALPAVTEYVYSIKRRDLKQVDLAAQTQATCLQNYDQIQSMKNSLGN
jgi:hypothetical protein